jgi:rubrerythrin
MEPGSKPSSRIGTNQGEHLTIRTDLRAAHAEAAQPPPGRGVRRGLTRRLLVGAGTGVGLGIALGSTTPAAAIARAFDDPLLELVRLLKEAAEIEHDLMVQYLYGAFSVKPSYEAIVGVPVPVSDHLLGIAVQEMHHLRSVNALLGELGVRPVLTRQDFPYEVDIYPFPFRLEPLSRASLARYVYCEAPARAFERTAAASPADRAFLETMDATLGSAVRPNHVGTLYDAVRARLAEVGAMADGPRLDAKAWDEGLARIQAEGEQAHYTRFRELMMGTHGALAGRGDVWALPVDHANYPARQVPVDPTAWPGRPNTIRDEAARRLAWLGNLTYWSSMMLVNVSYGYAAPVAAALGQALMMGPLWVIARELPARGAALPFDPLSIGFDPGRDWPAQRRVIVHLLDEANRLADVVGDALPEALPRGTFTELARQAAALPI